MVPNHTSDRSIKPPETSTPPLVITDSFSLQHPTHPCLVTPEPPHHIDTHETSSSASLCCLAKPKQQWQKINPGPIRPLQILSCTHFQLDGHSQEDYPSLQPCATVSLRSSPPTPIQHGK